MHCFGISNHSPDQAIQFLQKRKVISSPSDVSVLPFGKRLKPGVAPKRNVLFLVSIADFFRNLPSLVSIEGLKVFVFASPLRINEIDGIVPLDFEHSEEYKGMAFNLTPLNSDKFTHALKAAEPTEVKRDTTNYLTQLVDSIKAGSLLNPLMTFIYMLPKASHQTPVKESIATGLMRGWSSDKIFEDIGNKGLKLAKRAADVLETLLQGDIANLYREAFAEYRESKKAGKTVNMQSLCKRYGTSDYEMRYILYVVEGMKTKSEPRGKSLHKINFKAPKTISKDKRSATGHKSVPKTAGTSRRAALK